MCFVGPRPERPEIVEKLAPMVPDYLDRLAVPPGVTGIAQLHLPADQSVECVFKKLGFDFTYIEHASLRLDLLVCLATAFKPLPLVGNWFCTKISGSPALLRACYQSAAELQRRASRSPSRSQKHEPAGAHP
jgi:hypothetical protein